MTTKASPSSTATASASTLCCVTCNPSGRSAGEARRPSHSVAFHRTLITRSDPAALSARNLSADGERVFFETTEALVAADTNGAGRLPGQRGNRASPSARTSMSGRRRARAAAPKAAPAMPR